MTPTPPSTTSSSAGAQSPDAQYRVVRKRNRVPLSCGPCRHRKLKCNRAHPCDNCVKRGDGASCQYATASARRKNTSSSSANGSPDEMQDRINRLESLVLSLMGTGGPAPTDGAAAAAAAASNQSATSGDHGDDDMNAEERDEDSEVEKVSKSIGIIKIHDGRQFYASEAHWWAILSDISEVKKYFAEHQKQYEEDMNRVKAAKMAGPGAATSLLFRGTSAPDKDQLLGNFPPRLVADKLIFRYFNSENPANRILHGPTFRKEYEQHWISPQNTPIPWLAMCFSLMSMALQSYYRAGDEPPEYRGKSSDMASTYAEWAAQCLVYADFTQPKVYMLEALCFYLQAEAARSQDTETGIWILQGVILRLAMRMGLHRDSKPYASISVFQGEMRRRLWSVMRTTDIFLSFQVGLSTMIKSSETDTMLPSNIYDEEFDENTKVLPRSRPATENTPMSFNIAMCQLTFVLGKILELTQAVDFPTYEATMKLDNELREAYSKVPQLLRLETKDEEGNDPANLVMQRYTVDLIYQKSQCILHRKFLAQARKHPRFAYSRRTCIEACIEMLSHQSTLYTECQPNGRLRSITWSSNLSLTTHDFLLAAMIICLDLYHTAEAEAQGQSNNEMYKWALERRDDMISAIERASMIWTGMRDQSLEAYKASTLLGVVLKQLRNHQMLRQQLQNNFTYTRVSNGVSPDRHVAPEHSAAMTLGMMSSGMTPDAMGLYDRGYLPPNPQRTGLTPQPMLGDPQGGMPLDMNSPFNGLFGGNFGTMPAMDMSASNLDWDAWDTFIQGANVDPSMQNNIFDSPYANGVSQFTQPPGPGAKGDTAVPPMPSGWPGGPAVDYAGPSPPSAS